MSQGGSIAYHLRTNKAVDRFAFIDTLSNVSKCVDLTNHHYVGFGGPFLEDFKLVHTQLGLNKLTSLEIDENVLERQRFNRPLTCINLKLQSAREFIDTDLANRREGDSFIAWLDYAIPRELPEQLTEVASFIRLSQPNDILKVTLNANAGSLGKPNTACDIRDFRLTKLQERIGQETVSLLIKDDLTNNRFPYAMARVLEYTILAAQRASDKQFFPLTCFTYSDGQPMLTLTGIILDVSTTAKKFLKNSGILSSPLGYKWGEDPLPISIPAFSVREKLRVDGALPAMSPSRLASLFKYNFADSRDDSVRMLRAYKMFYRYASFFGRVNV